ncbi:MAG: TcpQ domain-containing protein [Alphaproteobacteria bacterium]|nr:TcpQ domain-containing protein [Alphaproteobacteria bacterium]
MTATDLVLVALVLGAMAALGVMDGLRAIVDPRLVLALAGAGLLWRLFGPVQAGSLAGAFLGAVLGAGVAAAPILLAHRLRRRWPLFPGDAMLLAGFGFVLGPLGLGWSLLAGAILSLLYRAWLQRRRGRSFLKGYCPLGPGMAAGAMAVFVFVNAGGALAAGPDPVPLPPEARPGASPGVAAGAPRPGSGPAESGAAMLAATELAPLREPLPSSLAAREVAVDEPAPLPFAAVADRLSTLAGVRVEVEERPSRVAGGAAALPDPPDSRLAYEGRLPGLLDLVAALTGYDWAYRGAPPDMGVSLERGASLRDGGAIVFYRYGDVEQRAPEADAGAGRLAGTGAPAIVPRAGGEAAWTVDPARHGTVLDVLEDWGAGAGWSVVWKSGRAFSVGAEASFRGGFLDAVDRLLAAPATRRALVALAHEPNRHLVIHDAGAVR